jgi:type I restriction enzyme, R subunit
MPALPALRIGPYCCFLARIRKPSPFNISDSDPLTWQAHIGQRAKARRELIAKRAKNPDDPIKLVIVRDMWLRRKFSVILVRHVYAGSSLDRSLFGLLQASDCVRQSLRRKRRVYGEVGRAQDAAAIVGASRKDTETVEREGQAASIN